MRTDQEQVGVGGDVDAVGRRTSLNHLARAAVLLLVLACFAALYHRQSYAGTLSRNAADIAQVAKNISEGRGFTTRVVRPFNAPLKRPDSLAFPELNHAPMYPYALSLAFRLGGATDQVAGRTSVIFLLMATAATALLGTILFDRRTGLLAAAVVGTSAPVLAAGASGEEWAMASVWLALLLCMVAIHHGAAARERHEAVLFWTAAAAVAAAFLYATHHVLAAAAIPVLVYLAATGSKRLAQAVVFMGVLCLLAAPVVVRNQAHTGSAILGISAWDLMSNTKAFPGDTFHRSTGPANRPLSAPLLFPATHFAAFAHKLGTGSVDLLAGMVALLGPVAVPFAVVSALYRFRNPAANATRLVVYGTGLIVVVCAALFGLGDKALVVLAPAASVFACAYFLLLLDTKSLHPIYHKALVGAFVLVTAAPALTTIAWRPPPTASSETASAADRFFATAGVAGAKGVVYTDVPWIAAWRTECTAVWLPRTDEDVVELGVAGVPIQTVVLTPECTTYSPEEAWYVLHRVRLWREFITDPSGRFRKSLQAEGISADNMGAANQFLGRLRRNFALSESISGLVSQRRDPLTPDDIHVFIKLPG